MNSPIIRVCIGIGFAAAFVSGQSPKVDLKAEEATIRALIAKGGTLPRTEDRVYWAGPLKRPIIGSEKGEYFPNSDVGKRKNQKNTDRVQRLEVSASGDMAWEFSYVTIEYDVDETPARHVKVDAAMLRVWKKEAGQWKTAANFVRPLDLPFEPLPAK
jgi:hypothetical protein